MNKARLTIVIMICLSIFVGCSSAPRTKWTDPGMRVFIDPESVTAENFVRIQQALVKTRKFVVIDRGAGFNAVTKEQERLHRNQSDRFLDKEKFAHWGKLYGVRSIVVAHAQCENRQSFWNSNMTKILCAQYLSLVDANTGEVLVAVEGENSGDASLTHTVITPDWEETVEKLVAEYPKKFETEYYTKSITDYQDVSKEEAIRQKETQLRAPASE